jgi:hypothetical protein
VLSSTISSDIEIETSLGSWSDVGCRVWKEREGVLFFRPRTDLSAVHTPTYKYLTTDR